jgi:DNA-binding NtrC family response regulator
MLQHHILIVDGSQKTRQCLMQIFHSAGYRVTTAGNQRQAKSHLASARPDLILLSASRYNEGSLETLAYVKQMLPHVPVLIISHSAIASLKIQVLFNGAGDRSKDHTYRADLLDRIGVALALSW